MKLSIVDHALILELLGLLFANTFCFPLLDETRGGTIVAFNSDLFNNQTTSLAMNTVSTTIHMRASLAPWCVTTVYGPQGDTNKLAFINSSKLSVLSSCQHGFPCACSTLVQAKDKSNTRSIGG